VVRNVPRILTGNGPTRHTREKHPMWNPDPDYNTVHKRLQRYRGKASQHDCACGCGRRARDWAYTGPRDPRYPLARAFSTNLEEDYIPMTRECHKGLDMELLRMIGVRYRHRSRQGAAS
jgi:hypothetical protein